MKKTPVYGLATAGLIAALYVVLTLPLAQIAFGPIQFRPAELLTLLPFFTPWAIPGVVLGCLISNAIYSTVIDVIFGTLATLLAALLTYACGKLRKKNPKGFDGRMALAALPPVIFNGLIVGAVLTYMELNRFEWLTFWTIAGEVAAGEFVVCFLLGIPVMQILKKTVKF